MDTYSSATGAENIIVNEIEKIPSLLELLSQWRKVEESQMNTYITKMVPCS